MQCLQYLINFYISWRPSYHKQTCETVLVSWTTPLEFWHMHLLWSYMIWLYVVDRNSVCSIFGANIVNVGNLSLNLQREWREICKWEMKRWINYAIFSRNWKMSSLYADMYSTNYSSTVQLRHVTLLIIRPSLFGIYICCQKFAYLLV